MPITTQSLTPEILGGFFGAAMAAFFQLFPPAKRWIDKQQERAGLIMIGFSLLFALAMVGISCLGQPIFGLTCSVPSVWTALAVWGTTVVGNVSMYTAYVKPAKAKAARKAKEQQHG